MTKLNEKIRCLRLPLFYPTRKRSVKNGDQIFTKAESEPGRFSIKLKKSDKKRFTTSSYYGANSSEKTSLWQKTKEHPDIVARYPYRHRRSNNRDHHAVGTFNNSKAHSTTIDPKTTNPAISQHLEKSSKDSTTPTLIKPPLIKTIDAFNLTAVIDDPDGFTHVRSMKSASSQIVTTINKNEQFYTYLQNGNWWRLKTANGKIGFMHVSRIKLLSKP